MSSPTSHRSTSANHALHGLPMAAYGLVPSCHWRISETHQPVEGCSNFELLLFCCLNRNCHVLVFHRWLLHLRVPLLSNLSLILKSNILNCCKAECKCPETQLMDTLTFQTTMYRSSRTNQCNICNNRDFDSNMYHSHLV